MHDSGRTVSTFSPIAIVGRACVLPGAMSPAELWDRVVSGTDLTSAVPDGRWGIAPADVLCGPGDDSADRTWSDRGGYVSGFDDVFDATGFGLPAAEIDGLDPVFQWTFHTAREALRDAGYVDNDATRFGAVFGNLSFPSAGMAAFAQTVHLADGPLDTDSLRGSESRNRFMSGLPALMLERALDLGVGAMALDAACASSLYAIKLACDRLHDGDADLMLAGAVNCADDLFIHQGFTALNALSPTGQSRPFHPDANGLVPAEGCGFVALRRLDDAVRDGDTIHGIIRGIGLSNDGRGRGMLAPSADGQVRAMQTAFDVAGITPNDISLLECHATGTSVGDATEIESSARVYAECADLPIGSLKSNTGHLITAAGVAGVIKVIEAMRHEVRPPTLHVDEALDALDDLPFRVLGAAEPWDRGDIADGVLRAGVSAFGFGGNNAHLVLEEPPTAGQHVADGAERVVPDSAVPTEAIAIVGIGVAAASAVGLPAFRDALLSDSPCLDAGGMGRLPDIELQLVGQKFPPNDLKAALSQQLAMLQVTDEALADIKTLPMDTTGIYVGMGTDPEAARFGTRWRLAAQHDGTSQALAEARDLVGPSLSAAGVLGSMPNLVANRLNSQYDVAGPSFTVSGEEHSGLDALRIAVRALRSGEIGAALVGAVDLSCDPVHIAASAALSADRRIPGDAAVMLMLKRLDDAERDGDTVYSLVCAAPLDEDGAAADPRSVSDLRMGLSDDAQSISDLFGHAHAASGLLHVAAAATVLHHRVSIGDVPLIASNPEQGGGLPDGAGPRTVSVETTAMDGNVHRSVLLAEAANHLAPSRTTPPRMHIYSGADAAAVLDALTARRESAAGPARLVIVADDAEQLADRAARGEQHITHGKPPGTGVHFAAAPIDGELGFVFTAGGAAYNGMGTQLFRALPESITPISTNFPLGEISDWVKDPSHVPLPADYLWGTALLTQAHAEITLGLLGLRPSAAIGYSSGESNVLYAFGVWSDMDAMRREIDETGMLTSEIAVEFNAVARAWSVDKADWAVWNVLAPINDVRAAIADEPHVHLMLINTERDLVIAGDVVACGRIVDAFGAQRCRPVGYNLACHVPEVAAEFHQPWLDVHTRDVTPVPGVRFYSNGVGGAYDVSSENCAAAITRQAETTVDFPATIRAAYADGVRIFVEHGPAGACTNFIREILGDDVLALHLDRRDSNIEQLFDVCAALVAVGVEVDHDALTARLSQHTPERTASTGPVMSFPAHPAPVRRITQPAVARQTMVPAPPLPSVFGSMLECEAAAAAAPPAAAVEELMHAAVVVPVAQLVGVAQGHSAAASAADVMQEQIAAMAAMHQSFVAQQAAIHEQFLATRTTSLDLLSHAGIAQSVAPPPFAPSPIAQPPLVAPTIAQPPPSAQPAPPSRPRAFPVLSSPTPPVPSVGQYPGPKWDKAELEIHSSGRISELFGALFEAQDEYAVQCRMPEPPLLLADRVTGMVAEAGVLGTGTIWTETDIEPGAWYLNGGYMPAGFMIESGQADLMLISYMGIDLLNKGERSYRLLGCTMTYHGDLPTVGDTLEYEIRITGHAKHGDIRLFFFEYDCIVAGEPRLTVRDAQAGFFNEEELADALGALWTPESGEADLRADARVDAPLIGCTKSAFTADEVRAFSEGRVLDCFGPGFEWTETHTRTPKIQAGDQLFIDEITAFDPTGGPWGRGFMRCESTIADDAWFFDGHFKNDPCMPGNFMVEACIEAMSLYLAALGHTTRVDGWRFQPLPEQPFELKCRGEINPQTDRVAYELYVEEIWDGPHPTLICDVLGFVDGKAAFHAHRLGVELVPGWPLTSMPEVWEHVVEPVAVATDAEGFAFDWKAMISCAWGKPAEAFGSMYEPFDATRRSPRLPGEPYHFISRVTQIDGDLDDCKAGLEIVCEYDIPDDAWYFDENGAETMPFAVLLEAALQPCGWVASAVGSANNVDEDLLFRNLDGTGTVVGELTRTSGILSTRVKLTSVSRAGGMIVEGFEVVCSLGDRVVYTMETVFGFFPPEAFEDQVGLPVTSDHQALSELITASAPEQTDLTARPEQFCAGTARLANEMLLMVDRVAHVEAQGDAGLGVIVGEKDVDVSEWFFKAHFFQDPVQPGSLGVEALLQLLQYFMLDTGMDVGVDDARFEPMLLGAPMVWKYRGQVTPKNEMITTVMEITEVGVDEVGPFVIGAGSLWCDGLRIYEVSNMGMRLVPGAPSDAVSLGEQTAAPHGSVAPAAGVSELPISVDLAHHPQLIDHSVNGVPVVPVVFVIEWFARLAAAHAPDQHLASLTDLRVLSGLIAKDYFGGGSLDLIAAVVDSDSHGAHGEGQQLTLQLTNAATGRAHYRCTAHLSAATPLAEGLIEQTEADSEPWTAEVYFGDVLFHGPSFRVIEEITGVSEQGIDASCWGVRAVGWPAEAWASDPALLDGALQLALLWTERELGLPSLPTAIGSVQLFSEPTFGQHAMKLIGRRATAHMVVCDVEIRSAGGDIVAQLSGIETHVRSSSSP
jgi:acyl transferase domain-containing protein/3-hydroxymyristoyl/3-hydroxydecanoyl-(acyl carrier protein) dehydratase